MKKTRISNLNIKQWVAILQMVLRNDTNSLKDKLVFFMSMAEISGKDTVDLEARSKTCGLAMQAVVICVV
jgi:hypothetical protein